MSLSDFVQFFNSQLPFPSAALRLATPFISENARIVVYFASIRLESGFSAIIDTATGQLRGHVAQLRASEKESRRPFDSDDIFNLAIEQGELVFFDRLVRTLHTINYLIHPERQPGSLLLLKVHPHHVASVASDHGLAFEEILRACDLLPAQITLELDIDGADNTAHLLKAFANYKSRGYGTALNCRGASEADLALLTTMQPSLVRLDTRQLNAGKDIRPFVGRLHTLGAKTLIQGLEADARRQAAEYGFDLLLVGTTKH